MSDLTKRFANTALRLLSKQGQTATLKHKVGESYDPATGTNVPTYEDHTITFIVQQASQGTLQSFDIRFDGNTLIETNIRALVVAAKGLTITPQPGDKVTGLEGSQWNVLGNTPVNPAGVPVLYEMTVRR
jgi:hypothetical protein